MSERCQLTPKEFLTGLVQQVDARADAFEGVNWILGYDFAASNDGVWHIVIEDGKPFGPFEGENPEATITTLARFPTFVEGSRERFDPMKAMWNTGKVRFHGDAMVAHRFNKLLKA